MDRPYICIYELINGLPGHKIIFAISRHSARAKFTIAWAGKACGGKLADFHPSDRAHEELQNAFLDDSLAQKEAEIWAFKALSNLPIFDVHILMIFGLDKRENP